MQGHGGIRGWMGSAECMRQFAGQASPSRHKDWRLLTAPHGGQDHTQCAWRMPQNLPSARPLQSACRDRKSTRLNSSHLVISYAVFCLKKKKDGYTNSLLFSVGQFPPTR